MRCRPSFSSLSASRNANLVSRNLLFCCHNIQTEASSAQQFLQAPEFGVALLGKHSIDRLAVQIGARGDLRDPTGRIDDVAERLKECHRIVIACRFIQIGSSSRGIVQPLQQVISIRDGRWDLISSHSLSNIFLRF
jgi:hypothetical protein